MVQTATVVRRSLLIFIVLVTPCLGLPAAADDTPTPRELEQDVERFSALIKQEGPSSRNLNALGFAYYQLNRLPEAVDAFSRAISLDPSAAVTYNNLGATYLRRSEYTKAEEAFRTALKLDPANVKAAYNLSAALYRQKRYIDAYRAYRRAKSIDDAYVEKRMDDSGARQGVRKEVEEALQHDAKKHDTQAAARDHHGKE
jgi:tetratricopeptide (TPR) repeat protein